MSKAISLVVRGGGFILGSCKQIASSGFVKPKLAECIYTQTYIKKPKHDLFLLWEKLLDIIRLKCILNNFLGQTHFLGCLSI